MMRLAKQGLLPVVAAGFIFLGSCKKEVSGDPGTPPPTDTTVATSPEALLKDSVLFFSREIYLWYKQIPSSFNPRDYEDPNAIMTAIRQYSNEPGFATPVDRWSFAVKQDVWDDISSGIAGDFGLNVFFRETSDLRVKHVEAASPAGKAGIKRGWRITKINGSTNISTNNVDFIVTNVFESSSTSFTFLKPDGTSADIALTSATYQENPIILDSVYAVGGKKIGYLAFNSFLGNKTQVFSAFDAIFSKFASQQVTDIIVDLRYNGGGYVDVQEKLANYLAPTAANGNLMMKQEFNDILAQYNSADNFSKLGTLNLSRIFFIVSRSTASASELLINNLKPYMDVKLLGPDKTYGKPVGYFPQPVGDWYIFPVSFRTTNKNGEGAYFDGLPLTKSVADGLDKDWGDLQESCLASAVSYITTGAFTGRADGARFIEKPEVMKGNTMLGKTDFKGTIDARRMP